MTFRPEDLGIAAFAPEPTAKEQNAALVRKADEVRLRIGDLAAAAERVANDNLALKGAYERSQAAGQRLSVELFQVTRALEEARQHRAILFGLLVLAVLFLR